MEADGVVTVHLRVLSAADLPKTDMFGSTDPYVKVFHEEAELGCTATLINEPNPTWEEVRAAPGCAHARGRRNRSGCMGP